MDLSKEETDRVLLEYLGWVGGATSQVGPSKADYDFKIFKDGIFDHYLEVKIRRHNFNKFSDVMLPVRKHAFAEHIFNKYGIETIFLCGFTDGFATLSLIEEPDREEERQGRYDRGDYGDWYIFYNLSRFRFINYGEETDEEYFKKLIPD